MDAAYSLITDFLSLKGLTESLRSFEAEWKSKSRFLSGSSSSFSTFSLLERFFFSGDSTRFWSLIEETLPQLANRKNEVLLFQLHVYFTIYPLLPPSSLARGGAQLPSLPSVSASSTAAGSTRANPSSQSHRPSASSLALYQQRLRPLELFFNSFPPTENPLLLPFYALPHVANPLKNRHFAHLFQPGFGESLWKKCEKFLRIYINPSHVAASVKKMKKKVGQSQSQLKPGMEDEMGVKRSKLEVLIDMARNGEMEGDKQREAARKEAASANAAAVEAESKRRLEELVRLMSTSIQQSHAPLPLAFRRAMKEMELVMDSMSQSAPHAPPSRLGVGVSLPSLESKTNHEFDPRYISNYNTVKMQKERELKDSSSAPNLFANAALNPLAPARRLALPTIQSASFISPALHAHPQAFAAPANTADSENDTLNFSDVPSGDGNSGAASARRDEMTDSTAEVESELIGQSNLNSSHIGISAINFSSLQTALKKSEQKNPLFHAAVVQALRWRLTSPGAPALRRLVLFNYIQNDIFQLKASSNSGQKDLFSGLFPDSLDGAPSASLLTVDSCVRLINVMASYAAGRSYLLHWPQLLPALFHCLVFFNNLAINSEDDSSSLDSALPHPYSTRDQALGALQKFSLIRKAQSKMIQLGVIEWAITNILQLAANRMNQREIEEHSQDSGSSPNAPAEKSHRKPRSMDDKPSSGSNSLVEPDSLTEYAREYGCALLMNLSLRTAGKQRFIAPNLSVLPAVCSLLECESPQVKTYINGTLYSLLNQPQIREQAILLEIQAEIEEVRSRSSGKSAQQLDYILQQLAQPAEEWNSAADSLDDSDDEEDEMSVSLDMENTEGDIDLNATGSAEMNEDCDEGEFDELAAFGSSFPIEKRGESLIAALFKDRSKPDLINSGFTATLSGGLKESVQAPPPGQFQYPAPSNLQSNQIPPRPRVGSAKARVASQRHYSPATFIPGPAPDANNSGSKSPATHSPLIRPSGSPVASPGPEFYDINSSNPSSRNSSFIGRSPLPPLSANHSQSHSPPATKKIDDIPILSSDPMNLMTTAADGKGNTGKSPSKPIAPEFLPRHKVARTPLH